jgi:Kef-type K+ transport system membrane component KefB
MNILPFAFLLAAEGGHSSEVSYLVQVSMMELTLIIVAAKMGGELMGRLHQPPVLGELVIGMLLGNLSLAGVMALERMKTDVALSVVAEIGVILLLFEVGLESDLEKLLAVGWSSLLVAGLGVVAPMILGYGVARLFLPDANSYTHLFVGATLTATSVGITARVLKDLRASDTKEARIILGAAVVDDVIGLVVLAVVTGLVVAASAGQAEAISWLGTGWIIAKACLFLAAAVLVGRYAANRMFHQAARLRVPGALIALCITFCFVLATLAGWAGLAPIVGAFAAGLVLEPVHYRSFTERGERHVEDLLFPITTLIVPVFFFLMGLHVDLRSFASAPVLGFAALVTVAAILGKQVCGLGVLERGVNRLAVGVGMIPRGEVGLIFAGIGSGLILNGQPIFPQTTFSAMVLMVMVTTFITPPALKIMFRRQKRS